MTTRGQSQAKAAREHGLHTATWRALGTSVQLVVTDNIEPARVAVQDVLTQIDEAASRFREDSELSRLQPNTWTDVSPLFARAVQVARDAAEWTDGLVDPTLGDTLRDLGYDRTFTLVARDGPAVTVRRPSGGWRQIAVDGHRIKAPAGLDLGATAKGLAADLAAEAAAPYCQSVMVSLGGDIATAGSRAWPVLVTDTADPDYEDPGGEHQDGQHQDGQHQDGQHQDGEHQDGEHQDGQDQDGQVISLVGALATSGTAARRWTRGGQLLHHLLDPRTGMPTRGPWRTASVLASTCVLANVASTAAIVCGDRAPRWLKDRSFSARLVRTDGTVLRVGDWPIEEDT